MDLEVVVGALGEDLGPAGAEVGDPRDELLGRRGGGGGEAQGGHGGLLGGSSS
jgi:hypothetical protein